MNQPKVTVVIPIYNVEGYLDRCVDTVVSQSYNNLEIILVDDGSTDSCPEICDGWAKKDSRIKVIHKENEGLGMARNTGIDNATGEYILFFDSDDYVDVTLVEKCVSDARINGSDAVIFGYSNAFQDGRVENVKLRTKKTVFEGAEIFNELLSGMYIYEMGFGSSCCMKMFSMEIINRENIRFKSEREIISEDSFFALEYFSKINKASIIDENLYFYYKRTGSLTTSFRKDRQEKNDVFLLKATEFIDANNLHKGIKPYVVARYHMYTVGALKHILRSDLSQGEKRDETDKILHNKVLRDSIDFGVLRLHKLSLKAFFVALKLRAYFICRLLISFKK